MNLILCELLVGIVQDSLKEFQCKRNEASYVDVIKRQRAMSLCPPLSTACEEACENTSKLIAMGIKYLQPPSFSLKKNGMI